jgi:hypothetical protein
MSCCRLPLVAAAALFLACAAPLLAHAQKKAALDDPYFAAGFMLAVGGDVDAETHGGTLAGAAVSSDNGISGDGSPEVGLGGGLTYMHPLHRYFGLGGRFAIQTWRIDTDADTGRNIAFDLALVPQGRLPITSAIELYLALPIGLTYDVLNQYDTAASVSFANVMAGLSLKADSGFGWNLAALLGARFAISSGFGLFADVGYAFHSFSHTLKGEAALGGAAVNGSLSVDITLSQVAIDIGAYF